MRDQHPVADGDLIDPAALAAALDVLVAATGHRKFRDYCDPGHPDYDPRYIAVVIRQARGDPSPAVHYGDPSPGPCGGCPGG